MIPIADDAWWDAGRLRAAILCADDSLLDYKIAQLCGVTTATLYRWKLYPAFAARVKAIREESLARAYEEGISEKRRRLEKLNSRIRSIETVWAARAARYRALMGLDSIVDDPSSSSVVTSDTDDETIVSDGTGISRDDEAVIKGADYPEEALTGKMIRQKRVIGSGENAETIYVWTMALGEIREYRELLKAAAVEMGQWDEAPARGEDKSRGRIFDGAVVNIVTRAAVATTEPEVVG